MNLLSNLLPGTRQLRAPLAAGYLWLVALGLALASEIPSRDDASGLFDDLYRGSDLIGDVGVGVAVSFLAYLLGMVSLSSFAWPV
ncbi:MAG: hypothetical protein M3376_13405, partial [Actinomycetota bacterium]|nr:hypothetical protein [Actinomycetota bacterium]